jgi:beta-glucosidase
MKPYFKNIVIVAIGVFLVYSCKPKETGIPVYLNPVNPVEKRVEDLLSKMTLREKIGQMNQYAGPDRVTEWFQRRGLNTGDNQREVYTPVKEIKEKTRLGEIGSFLFVSGAKEANELQRIAENSRLKIPLLIAIDAIHGHAMFPQGATVFPTNIGLSCSWDTELAGRIASVTASEMAASGFNWNFFPTVDILRDPRWGRTGETFGEDPYLVTLFSLEFVRALQQNKPPILACSKGFIGHSQPVNGLNFAPTEVGERTLREVFLPPYIATINEGVGSIMAGHNDVNRVPMHSNYELLTGLLREELGFKGIIISDWLDIAALHGIQKVAATEKEAVKKAVNAGIDIHMHGPGFLEPLIELVEGKQVSLSRIDDAVRKILHVKFEYGLFENRYVDEVNWESKILTPEHRALALEAAEKSIVLLKNENDLLPLSKNIKSIFITGPNANNHALLGDWALDLHPDRVTTILEGIENIAGENVKIDYFDCGGITMIDEANIKKAADRAKRSDLSIVVVGGDALRVQGNIRTNGENTDRPSIDLVGKQLDLVKSIHASGKPVIVVFISGRPTSEPWIAENVQAIVNAWEPGMEGGTAVARLLFGKINPSAKLTVTFPGTAGHIPTYYNHMPTMYYRKYKHAATTFLYDFGFGLSYTSFSISAPSADKEIIPANGTLRVTCQVKNTGKRAGAEIVQLYIRDDYSSVVRPVKELKAFEKVMLQPGEEKTVKFSITPDMLAFWDINMNYTIEPGDFTVMVGNSSRDEDLKSLKFRVE